MGYQDPLMNPYEVLQNVVNHHRANSAPPSMQPSAQPEEIHQRITNLAHEILNSRRSRLQKSLGGLRRGPMVGPPTHGPFQS